MGPNSLSIFFLLIVNFTIFTPVVYLGIRFGFDSTPFLLSLVPALFIGVLGNYLMLSIASEDSRRIFNERLKKELPKTINQFNLLVKKIKEAEQQMKGINKEAILEEIRDVQKRLGPLNVFNHETVSDFVDNYASDKYKREMRFV